VLVNGKRAIAIDNGFAFAKFYLPDADGITHVSPFMSGAVRKTGAWRREVIDSVKKFKRNERTIRKELSSLIPKPQIDDMFIRVDHLLANPNADAFDSIARDFLTGQFRLRSQL